MLYNKVKLCTTGKTLEIIMDNIASMCYIKTLSEINYETNKQVWESMELLDSFQLWNYINVYGNKN